MFAMCSPCRFLLLALLVSVSLTSLLAQTTAFEASADSVFLQLKSSQIPTGILANRRAFVLDPQRYDGSANADTLRTGDFGVLYEKMRLSGCNATLFRNEQDMTATVEAERAQGRQITA